MEQEGPSFWAEIKKYEDTLERDPNSYCFAPLSELYRKLGMVDDAIIVARRGCDIHPEYVGGYMALGRAYLEKGMNAESRESLEKVVRVTPDNLLAQRILSRIYMDAGEVAAAEQSLRIILSHNPEDSESQMLLQSLIRTSGAMAQPFHVPEGDKDDISFPEIENGGEEHSQLDESDELLELEEWDIVEEDDEENLHELIAENNEVGALAFPQEKEEKAEVLSGGDALEEKDPLTTVTLAELFVSQGFPKRALTIFRELLEADPENQELKNRIRALKLEIDEDEVCAREHSLDADSSDLDTFEAEGRPSGGLTSTETDAISREDRGMEDDTALGASFIDGGIDDLETPVILAEEPDATQYAVIPTPSGADLTSSVNEVLTDENSHPAGSQEHVIRTLEIWLENIKRRR
jgi:tetratricopeptide (TPR) repeat protein